MCARFGIVWEFSLSKRTYIVYSRLEVLSFGFLKNGNIGLLIRDTIHSAPYTTSVYNEFNLETEQFMRILDEEVWKLFVQTIS